MQRAHVLMLIGTLVAALAVPGIVSAQAPAPAATAGVTTVTATATPELELFVPPDYVIGPDDHLSIVYWRDETLSAKVVVRPDGKISLPLINDIKAIGLTPEQLRVSITKAATQFVQDPTVSVVIEEINSRKASITGEVAKPGTFALTGETTVMTLIAAAGGLLDYAKREKIFVTRTENGVDVTFQFNYKEYTNQKNLKQNIKLKPGDIVVVP